MRLRRCSAARRVRASREVDLTGNSILVPTAALRRIGLFVAELDEMKRMLRLAYPENYAKMDEYRELDEKKGPD